MKKHKNLLCWIYGLCFVIVWLFPGRVMSQIKTARAPIAERCGYNMETLYSKGGLYTNHFKYLPVEFFPWGVCLNGNTSRLEDAWTEYAVNKWNEGYIKYKEKVWESAYVNGIPGQLFTISCDDSKYNLIYVRKENLPDNTLGIYTQNFKAKVLEAYIKMDTIDEWGEPRVWKKEHFINVMTHELGHGLALPHMNPDRTELMRTAGFGCVDPDNNICNFTDADWDKFLWPYEPEKASKKTFTPSKDLGPWGASGTGWIML